jgi:precorrin-8X/cobalt-precorrin-8 methylmutase
MLRIAPSVTAFAPGCADWKNRPKGTIIMTTAMTMTTAMITVTVIRMDMPIATTMYTRNIRMRIIRMGRKARASHPRHKRTQWRSHWNQSKAPRMRPYEKDPKAIYAESFATVAREADLTRFPHGLDKLATRVIHACGMVEVADRLAFSEQAFRKGAAALAAGAPILCDCEMVGAGIIRRYLPAENPVIVTLNDPSVPALAQAIGNTRSAAAVELWAAHLEGAVVAIGNAPTALFHLLELLDHGAPKPAVILGFPVGFVGAAESKAELAANPRGCDFVALRGRRGGSAIASAAVNALSAGLPELVA